VVPKDPAGNRTAEQIDDAVTGATYNNMNQLVSQQAGGALVFKGTVSEPANVTVGGRPATVTADNRFEGQAAVPGGTGHLAVTATDPSGNLRTNTYEVTQGATSKSFTYDANGNMTSDGTRTYEWDAENRLVAISTGMGTIRSYTYRGDGMRAAQSVSAWMTTLTTTYVLDGAQVVEERPEPPPEQANRSPIWHFHGPGIDNVLAMKDRLGAVTYLTRDHLGSVREELSPEGILQRRRDYDPWGRLVAGGVPGGAFTGQDWDSGTGLYYYRARYYEPTIGRFLSEDPIWNADRNRYRYGRDAPTRFIDPSGLRISVWLTELEPVDVTRTCEGTPGATCFVGQYVIDRTLCSMPPGSKCYGFDALVSPDPAFSGR
jgi:RHS repeat-associated protein